MSRARNVIEHVNNSTMNKQDFMELINSTFPDEEVGTHGKIVQITTTELTDGTINQSIVFGKLLKNV